jgi:hypothetical protein
VSLRLLHFEDRPEMETPLAKDVEAGFDAALAPVAGLWIDDDSHRIDAPLFPGQLPNQLRQAVQKPLLRFLEDQLDVRRVRNEKSIGLPGIIMRFSGKINRRATLRDKTAPRPCS